LTNLLLAVLGVLIAAGTYEYYCVANLGGYIATLPIVYQILAVIIVFLVIILIGNLVFPIVISICIRLELYSIALVKYRIEEKEKSVQKSLHPLIEDTAERLLPKR
jgi:hypothetical protein